MNLPGEAPSPNGCGWSLSSNRGCRKSAVSIVREAASSRPPGLVCLDRHGLSGFPFESHGEEVSERQLFLIEPIADSFEQIN